MCVWERGGLLHRDRLSGKARGVRGEDLVFMLETGQGWAAGQSGDGPGIHLEWNDMVWTADTLLTYTKTSAHALKAERWSHEDLVQPRPTGRPAKTTHLLLGSNAI